MNVARFKGELLKEATEKLLGRNVSGDEIAEISYLLDSIPGKLSDRAAISIRVYALKTPADTDMFFANADILHDVVTELERSLYAA